MAQESIVLSSLRQGHDAIAGGSPHTLMRRLFLDLTGYRRRSTVHRSGLSEELMNPG